VSDTSGTRNTDQEPLEKLIETQALSADLREAVMACLSGRESRRWTVLELVERFKNLGVCASRASVTAALAELGLELELSGWAGVFAPQVIQGRWLGIEALQRLIAEHRSHADGKSIRVIARIPS
jgi:hypothetical protein